MILRCVERAQTGQQYTMVSGVDESVCGVNSVMSAGVLDLCGVDKVVYGVDEPVCGVSSVMTAGELDVCGIDPVVSGADEYVWDVHSVMSAGVLDLCGVDKVVYGVDEPVCGVSSVMTAGELDVCGCDSLVSEGAGDSSGVEVVDDVVACGDDKLLPGAVRVGGLLSVAGIGVTQPPGWVDGIICADGSLRPEPPPMHSTCLRRMLLDAAFSSHMTIVSMYSTCVQIAACCLRGMAIASICQTTVTACQSEGCIRVSVLAGV